MYIAYVEAVMWVRGLDERFRRLDPSYTGRRDGHPQGQAVAGLCWVRDKGIHQLVTFHTKAERSENDLGLGPNFPDGDVAMWLPSSDVVEREPPRPSDTPKKAAYDRHLVGRPLWTVLADARNFLWMDAAALLAK